MTATDPALTKALDHLTMQVDRDNVLAVHKVFRDSADELQASLAAITQTAQIGLCGDDPVSRDAVGQASFGGKITDLLKVHVDHQRELDVAADHLRAIALDYGHTEEDIERSLDGRTR